MPNCCAFPQKDLLFSSQIADICHPLNPNPSSSRCAQQRDACQEGMKKDDYWSYALEDCLDVVAKVPIIAAKIYRRTFHDGKLPEQLDGRGARVSARARAHFALKRRGAGVWWRVPGGGEFGTSADCICGFQ